MKSRFLLVLALVVALAAPLAHADAASWLQDFGDNANLALAAAGSDVRIATAEYITAGDEAGQTLYFANVGNKQLTADFAPFDPRRTWNPTNVITYLVDVSDGDTLSGLPNAMTEPAIDRAMETWDSATECSDVPIVKVPDTGADPDLIDFLLGFGAPGGYVADLVHAGWTLAFQPPILGVTFTLTWVDGAGNPTDINGDHKRDVAWREIYYSSYYVWNIDANVDVETIALHEAGHGLSQGHFGTLFQTDANGLLHFAPRAVMNAGYLAPQQDLAGTDLAGHCSIWGDWPNQ
jgi:hypothetical protein